MISVTTQSGVIMGQLNLTASQPSASLSYTTGRPTTDFNGVFTVTTIGLTGGTASVRVATHGFDL